MVAGRNVTAPPLPLAAVLSQLDASDSSVAIAFTVMASITMIGSMLPFSGGAAMLLYPLADIQMAALLFGAQQSRIYTAFNITTYPRAREAVDVYHVTSLAEGGFHACISLWHIDSSLQASFFYGTLCILLIVGTAHFCVMLAVALVGSLSNERRLRRSLRKDVPLIDWQEAADTVQWPGLTIRTFLVLHPSVLYECIYMVSAIGYGGADGGRLFFGLLGVAAVVGLAVWSLRYLRWRCTLIYYRYYFYTLRNPPHATTVYVGAGGRRAHNSSARGDKEMSLLAWDGPYGKGSSVRESMVESGDSVDSIGTATLEFFISLIVPHGFWRGDPRSVSAASEVRTWDSLHDPVLGNRVAFPVVPLLRSLLITFFTASPYIPLPGAMLGCGLVMLVYALLVAILRPFRYRFVQWLSCVQCILVACFFASAAHPSPLTIASQHSQSLLAAITSFGFIQIFLCVLILALEKLSFVEKEKAFRKRYLYPIRINSPILGAPREDDHSSNNRDTTGLYHHGYEAWQPQMLGSLPSPLRKQGPARNNRESPSRSASPSPRLNPLLSQEQLQHTREMESINRQQRRHLAPEYRQDHSTQTYEPTILPRDVERSAFDESLHPRPYVYDAEQAERERRSHYAAPEFYSPLTDVAPSVTWRSGASRGQPTSDTFTAPSERYHRYGNHDELRRILAPYDEQELRDDVVQVPLPDPSTPNATSVPVASSGGDAATVWTDSVLGYMPLEPVPPPEKRNWSKSFNPYEQKAQQSALASFTARLPNSQWDEMTPKERQNRRRLIDHYFEGMLMKPAPSEDEGTIGEAHNEGVLPYAPWRIAQHPYNLKHGETYDPSTSPSQRGGVDPRRNAGDVVSEDGSDFTDATDSDIVVNVQRAAAAAGR